MMMSVRPYFVVVYTTQNYYFNDIDTPGPGSKGGHYFHAWCLSVRPYVNKQKQATSLKSKYYSETWSLLDH